MAVPPHDHAPNPISRETLQAYMVLKTLQQLTAQPHIAQFHQLTAKLHAHQPASADLL
jgi:hypothetical protein